PTGSGGPRALLVRRQLRQYHSAVLRGRVGKPAAEERRLTATDNPAEGSGSAQERRRPRQREAAAEARSGWSRQGEGRQETRVLAGEGVRTNRDEVNKTMRSAEGRGRTLDEAVDSALIELGETRRNVDVRVDVERYRQRREHTVREIALRAARQVKMTGDAITLDAMQAFERRAIHLALEGDPDVTSSSIGEDPDRRVVVGPRKPADA